MKIYSRNIQKIDLENIEENLRLNTFKFMDFENEYNSKKTIDSFNYFSTFLEDFPMI